jgi:hypothetical protein
MITEIIKTLISNAVIFKSTAAKNKTTLIPVKIYVTNKKNY